MSRATASTRSDGPPPDSVILTHPRMSVTPEQLSASLAGRYRIERELGAGGMVYAIGLQTTVLRRPGGGGGIGGFTGGMTSVRPDPGLATIADETGGGYFELNRSEDLASTFARVADELHRQYALGFDPPKLDDKMHKLEVRVTTKGAKVRARKEYFAGAPGNTSSK